jgi:HPt (histidine-containing phosphotransfer) domain-containing protein
MAIARAIETVRTLVPDLDGRIGRFETEPFELDDELVAAFFEELARLTGDLQTGLTASDNEMLRRAAHSIKGMCGTMGLPEISVLAQEIELTLRAGEMERCAVLCNALINWARDLIAAN